MEEKSSYYHIIKLFPKDWVKFQKIINEMYGGIDSIDEIYLELLINIFDTNKKGNSIEHLLKSARTCDILAFYNFLSVCWRDKDS